MTSSFASLWIDGKKREASDGATFEVRNALAGKVVGVAASASVEDAREAVLAASKAAKSWEKTPLSVKQAIFLKAVTLLDSDAWKTRILQTLQEETACSGFWGIVNLKGSRGVLMGAVSVGPAIQGSTFPSASAPGGHTIVQRKPHGVVLAIAPWNAPTVLTVRSLSVPLMCGNTVVAKGSENSPKSQELVIELMHEAGLPPGVLNFISCSKEAAPTVVTDLIANPLVRHINFTGSDRVGKIIAGEAAKYLKPCVFELGGKAPTLVLDDADIEAAARGIASGALLNSGQICMSTERVIVHRSVAQKFTANLRTHFEKIRAGDTKNGNQISSLASEVFAVAFEDYLQEAKRDGVQFLVGDLKRDGAVVQPHIITGLKPHMRAWQRESFGPIIGIVEVDSDEEAIELANSTDYSLTSSVWTRDVNRALDVASQVRAGQVCVNGSTFHSEPQEGEAGLGGATGYGKFDIDNFTTKRVIIVHPVKSVFPLVDF